MARRRTEVFTLSFLDCICCGFGAVVLFYTIISANSGAVRIIKNNDLTGEVSKLEEEVRGGTKNLVVLRNSLDKTRSETASAMSRANILLAELQRRQQETSVYSADSLARREHINKLKADVKALDESTRRLEAQVQDMPVPTPGLSAGRSLAPRRYITGLKLKGKRILVLIDHSASMLDEDLVEIIKLRNSSDAKKRAARKWRRGVDVVNWLTSQLPRNGKFQVYAFNTEATPLLDDSAGSWLDNNDAATIKRTLDTLDTVIPAEGTSLINALGAARKLSPMPDQIVLITDGLPTQGPTPPVLRKYVDANSRAKLFDEATRTMNRNTPVDVVLLPMKGDLPAAYRFWRLARLTGGSFLMPSPDWP